MEYVSQIFPFNFPFNFPPNFPSMDTLKETSLREYSNYHMMCSVAVGFILV